MSHAAARSDDGDGRDYRSLANQALGRALSEGMHSVRRWLLALSAALLLTLVLFTYGFLPGMSQTPLSAFLAVGQIQCLHDQGIASLWTWCMSMGLPVGAPRLTGVPWLHLGWLLSYVPGVDAWAAHQISMAMLVVAAFAGTVLLMRRWRIPYWIALVGTLVYLLAPNLIILNGFGYTFIGYVLVPAFIWVWLSLLDLFDRGRRLRASTGMFLLALVVAFTDGYVFISTALVVGLITVNWLVRDWRARGWKWSTAGGASALLAVISSGLLYAWWAPAVAYNAYRSADSFAIYGTDAVTLLVPSILFLYPDIFDLDLPDFGGLWMAPVLGTAYLGFITLGAVVFDLVAGAWKQRVRGRRELITILIVGLIALVLALGPSLKFAQSLPGIEESLFRLPTVWLYDNVPGFSAMRVTARWLVITRLAVIVGAAAGFALLWRRWRGAGIWRMTVVVVLVAMAAIETLPNLWITMREREGSIEKIHFIRDGVVAEADEMLTAGELILVLPSANDFLAGYLVPMTGTKSYNAGGDKNYHLAVSNWPDSVLAARNASGPDAVDAYCRALETDVDAIVLPYLDPYAAPLLRPRDLEAESERKEFARSFAGDSRFVEESGEWMTVLRRGPSGCGPN